MRNRAHSLIYAFIAGAFLVFSAVHLKDGKKTAAAVRLALCIASISFAVRISSNQEQK